MLQLKDFIHFRMYVNAKYYTNHKKNVCCFWWSVKEAGVLGNSSLGSKLFELSPWLNEPTCLAFLSYRYNSLIAWHPRVVLRRQRQQLLEGIYFHFRKGRQTQSRVILQESTQLCQSKEEVWEGPGETIEFTLTSTPRKQFLSLFLTILCRNKFQERNMLTCF